MPLTTSSSKEKELIYQLLSTGEVEISNTKKINGLNSKWVNYFTGRSLQTRKQSQMIIYNGSKWFEYSENILTFKFKSLSQFTKEIRKEVLEYLKHNKDKSDYLIKGRTYSKSEISFMFGHTHNVGKCFYNSSKKTSDGNDFIWVNYINYKNRELKSRDGKNIGSYKNEKKDDKTLLLSLDQTMEFYNGEKISLKNKDVDIHIFAGNDNLMKKDFNNYYYLGKKKWSDLTEFDIQKRSDESGKKIPYSRIEISLDKRLPKDASSTINPYPILSDIK